jgi:Winged helix DNA-binding domain
MTARRRGSMTVLDLRALNRALLARQLLLGRVRRAPHAAIEHLVGIQAQVPDSAYIALWSRLHGFQLEDLARLVRARRVVRIALMRSTIHLVTVRDGARLRPVVQTAVERGLWTGNYGRQLAGIDRDAVAAAGRAPLDGQPRTFSDLASLLAKRFPDRDGHALAMAVRGLLPLVQVTPRGVWGLSGPAAHATFEAWTGRKLETRTDARRLAMRYLAAFGPSTIADVQAWSGLTGLHEVIERLRPRLRTFQDEHGRELFDLPAAPLPNRDVPAPPRFLPEFDNVLLAHADRTRIIEPSYQRRLFAGAGLMLGTVLIDGFVGARWRLTRPREKAILLVETFNQLTPATRTAIEGEGERLLRFFAVDARSSDIRFRRG